MAVLGRAVEKVGQDSEPGKLNKEELHKFEKLSVSDDEEIAEIENLNVDDILNEDDGNDE